MKGNVFEMKPVRKSNSKKKEGNAYYEKLDKESAHLGRWFSVALLLVIASAAFTVLAFAATETEPEPTATVAFTLDDPVVVLYTTDITEEVTTLPIKEMITLEPIEEVTITSEPTPEPTPEPVVYEILNDEEAIIALCQMVWGEYRGPDLDQQAACVWCALNRVDHPTGYGSDIVTVITAPSQFSGYNPRNPVTDEIRWLVEDVLVRWEREKMGETDVGRVLPSDYYWFSGNSTTNYYRNAYAYPYNTWDWSLPSPYK